MLTAAALSAIFVLPLLVAVLSATVALDGPDTEEGEKESGLAWAAFAYRDFMLSMFPLIRDLIGGFKGFKSTSSYAPIVDLVPEAGRALEKLKEGELSAAGAASTAIKLTSSVVQVPGAVQVTKLLDYEDAANQGESIFSGQPWPVVQAVIEGKDKNK